VENDTQHITEQHTKVYQMRAEKQAEQEEGIKA
jgi:hypothetical protein